MGRICTPSAAVDGIAAIGLKSIWLRRLRLFRRRRAAGSSVDRRLKLACEPVDVRGERELRLDMPASGFGKLLTQIAVAASRSNSAASCSGRLPSTRMPVSSCRTSSRMAGRSPEITGTPHAIASISTTGMPSRSPLLSSRQGRANTSASAQQFANARRFRPARAIRPTRSTPACPPAPPAAPAPARRRRPSASTGGPFAKAGQARDQRVDALLLHQPAHRQHAQRLVRRDLAPRVGLGRPTRRRRRRSG